MRVALQRLHVRDHVLDLAGVEHILEGRHQVVAILNPGLQRFVGHFVVVHRERSALSNPLQPGPIFFASLSA